MDDDKKALLLVACESGDVDTVTAMLNEDKDLIECRNEHHMTPLILAAIRGHYNIVLLLLERGALINEHDILGRTALIRASSKGRYDVVELLLDEGADGSIRDNVNHTYVTIKDAYVRGSNGCCTKSAR